MKSSSFRTFIMLAFALGTFATIPSAQTGFSDSVQNPPPSCLDEAGRAARAEIELAATRLELKTCMARQVDELARARGVATDAERRLTAEQSKVAEKGVALVEQKKANEQVTLERDGAIKQRDGLALKIKAVNGRFFCEKFRVGCVE